MSEASPSSPGCVRAARIWSQLRLDRRYLVASLPVLLVATLGLGSWVTRSIEEQVIVNTAANASLFVNSFVSPELQGLAKRQSLIQDEAHMLSTLLIGTPLGRRILSFKVWGRGGRIAYYSRDAEQVGRVFPPSAKLRKAWTGKVTAELSPLDEAEHAGELALGVPLLEVYMPVHERGSDKIVAVAEFYQDATELEEHLRATRVRTWLVVAVIMLLMYGGLFGIVHAGGRLIRRQAAELEEKVSELSELLAQNEALRERVGRATRRVTELNEGFLRRVSADLHDGPAQALSLALLRLDRVAMPALTASAPGDDGNGEIEQIRTTLQEALRELRDVCRGLSLPEVADLSIAEVVELAAVNHHRRTRTAVQTDIAELQRIDAVSMPIKLTAYRFAQEALMNAFRHAGGKGQTVSARRLDGALELRVSDRGAGIAPHGGGLPERMGLSGLRERVEALGGRFRVESTPGRGTTLLALLPLT